MNTPCKLIVLSPPFKTKFRPIFRDSSSMLNTNSATSLDTMSADIADAKDTVVASANKANRMKGMKIRDEFICPITYELMRDPVVASDGHTYEKAAIEKWLKHHQISPRNGEPMVSFTLPNMNMKKLIQDIIDEVFALMLMFVD